MAATVRRGSDDLTRLVRFFAERIADEDAVPELVDLTVRHIDTRLPRYEWPGNLRELRDCVTTLHHGGELMPLALQGRKAQARGGEHPLQSLIDGRLSDNSANRRYRTYVLALLGGNINEAAGRLGPHRNTVARSVDHPRLERWRARPSRRPGC